MAGNANSGGRNKKSEHLHVLQGTYRPDRHADMQTPDPPSGDPVCPEILTGEARAEWDRMLARMKLSGTLTKVDDAALLHYCLLHAEVVALVGEEQRLVKLGAKLQKLASSLKGDGLIDAITKIVELEQLVLKQRLQLRQGHLAARQWLVEFGLTPAARTRVKAAGGDKPSKSEQEKRRERFFGIRGGASS